MTFSDLNLGDRVLYWHTLETPVTLKVVYVPKNLEWVKLRVVDGVRGTMFRLGESTRELKSSSICERPTEKKFTLLETTVKLSSMKTIGDLQVGDRVVFWSKDFEGETLKPVTFEIVNVRPNGQRVIHCIESLSNVWKIGQITSEHPKKPILDSPKYREYTLPEDLQGEIKLSSEQEVVEYYESLLKTHPRRMSGDDLKSGMLVKITVGSPRIYKVSRSVDDPRDLYLELMFDGVELILGSPDAWPNWEQYWVVADSDESPDEIKLASETPRIFGDLTPGQKYRTRGGSPAVFEIVGTGKGHIYSKCVVESSSWKLGQVREHHRDERFNRYELVTGKKSSSDWEPKVGDQLVDRDDPDREIITITAVTGTDVNYEKRGMDSYCVSLSEVRHRLNVGIWVQLTPEVKLAEHEPTIGSRWLRFGQPVTIVEGSGGNPWAKPGDIFFVYDTQPTEKYYVGRDVFDEHFKPLDLHLLSGDEIKLSAESSRVIGDLSFGDRIDEYVDGVYQRTYELCRYERAKYYLGKDNYEEYVLIRGWIPLEIVDYKGKGANLVIPAARDVVLLSEPKISGHCYVESPENTSVKLAVDRLLYGEDSYEVVTSDRVPQHIVGDVTWVKTAEGLRYVAEDVETILISDLPVGTRFRLTLGTYEVITADELRREKPDLYMRMLEENGVPCRRNDWGVTYLRGPALLPKRVVGASKLLTIDYIVIIDRPEETVKLASTQMSKLPEGTVIEVNTGPEARTFTIISEDEFHEHATSEQRHYYHQIRRGLVPVRWDDGSYGATLDQAVDTNSGNIWSQDSTGKPMGVQHRVKIKLAGEIVYDWVTVWIDYHLLGFTEPLSDIVTLSAYLSHASLITVKAEVGPEIASSSEGRVTVGKVKANSGKYTPLSSLIPFSVQLCGTREDIDDILNAVDSGALGEKYTLTQKQRSRLDPRVKLARGESTVHGIVTEQEEIPHTHPKAQLPDVPSAMIDTQRRSHRPGSVVYGSLQQMLPSSPGTIIAGEDGQANVIRNEDADSGVGMTRTHHPDIDPAPYSDRYVGTQHRSNEIKLSAIS